MQLQWNQDHTFGFKQPANHLCSMWDEEGRIMDELSAVLYRSFKGLTLRLAFRIYRPKEDKLALNQFDVYTVQWPVHPCTLCDKKKYNWKNNHIKKFKYIRTRLLRRVLVNIIYKKKTTVLLAHQSSYVFFFNTNRMEFNLAEFSFLLIGKELSR